MANNELSGPVVATFLAKWIQELPVRRYNYRFVFIPETIGSITYLSRHWQELKAKVVAGFNLTVLGMIGATPMSLQDGVTRLRIRLRNTSSSTKIQNLLSTVFWIVVVMNVNALRELICLLRQCVVANTIVIRNIIHPLIIWTLSAKRGCKGHFSHINEL